MEKELSNDAVPRFKRLENGLLALRGLELTGMASKARRILESGMSAHTRMLSAYDIKEFSDYRKISEKDMDALLKNLSDMRSEILRILEAE